MTLHAPLDDTIAMEQLSKAAAALGYEIVDIAGFLELVDGHARHQQIALRSLTSGAEDMRRSNTESASLVSELSTTADQALQEVQASVAMVRSVSEKSQGVAGWVKSVAERSGDVSETVRNVRANNTQIASIAVQVNTLAINAKIEAARAGDAGRGFAVVADAINQLSQKTKDAATQISQNIQSLSEWVSHLQNEANKVSTDAEEVLSQSSETDGALGRMEETMQAKHAQTLKIADCSERVRTTMEQWVPAVSQISAAVQETTTGVEKTHSRINQLIDASEGIVQSLGALGAASPDSRFVAKVCETARAISATLDEALSTGKITQDQLFDQQYRPVPGSDPQQMTTRALSFLEQILPGFQEPVLNFDPSVVFCAAVDTMGYLPVHNNRFSQPQRDDPVWNAANCRNRRIFDDRVGLKAGRSTAPFLLQVYRRDMGGGTFRVMKDLSAPIRAGGRHWGGLRLAYANAVP